MHGMNVKKRDNNVKDIGCLVDNRTGWVEALILAELNVLAKLTNS